MHSNFRTRGGEAVRSWVIQLNFVVTFKKFVDIKEKKLLVIIVHHFLTRDHGLIGYLLYEAFPLCLPDVEIKS